MTDSTPPGAPRRAFGSVDVLLLLMAVIWGTNYSAVKYALQTMSPLTFTALRIAVTAVAMFIVAIGQRKAWPSRRDTIVVIGLGVLGNGIYQLLFSNGVARTRIADAALIVAAAPAFIAIIGRLRGVERISWRTACGIALSIVGVGVVILGSSSLPQRQGTVLGATFMIGAVLCWSIYSVSLRDYTRRIDAVQLNALSMTGGLIPMLFVAPVIAATPWSAVTGRVWLCIAYAGIVSMGVAYLFYMKGLRVLGPTRTAVYGNLQPPVAILVAWAALGETPTMWQGAGAALIIGGIFLTRT